MTKQLTPEQRAKLQEIATGVKGSYKQLPISDVLNRIHFITNRDYRKCIEGLKLMLHEGMIKADFVIGLETLERLEKAVDRAMPIIEATQSQLVNVSESVSDGPKDDEDDGWQVQEIDPMKIARDQEAQRLAKEIDQDIMKFQSNGLNLSHINSNF